MSTFSFHWLSNSCNFGHFIMNYFLFLQFLVLDMLEAQTAGSALGSEVKDSLLNFPPPLHCSDFGLYGPSRELCGKRRE